MRVAVVYVPSGRAEALAGLSASLAAAFEAAGHRAEILEPGQAIARLAAFDYVAFGTEGRGFGGKIPALQLYDWGVVNRVFPMETLEADTLWFARQLAGMFDASIHLTKNIMNALADGNLEACLEAESTASPFCTTTKAYAATMEKFAR